MVSGLFVKKSDFNSFKSLKLFITKRLKRLYIPFVIANSCYLIFNNLFLKIGFYTNNPGFLQDSIVKNNFGIVNFLDLKSYIIEEVKILLFLGGTQFGGSLWFLRSLFFIECLYAIICFVANKLKIKEYPFIIILFLLGYVVTFYKFSSFDIVRIVFVQITIPIIMFYFGSLIKKNIISYINNNNIIISCVIFILSGLLLYCCYKMGFHNDLSNGTIDSPIHYIIISFIGFINSLALSCLISRLNYVEKSIKYIGKNTMPILICHLLFFKVVTIIQIIMYYKKLDLPEYSLASFPTLITAGVWPYIYCIVGIIGSLLLNNFYLYIILLFRRISK